MYLNRKWKSILTWVLLTEAVGGLAGWLTRAGTAYISQFARKPALTPPAAVFPAVWAVLYALMGVGAGLVAVSPAGAGRTAALRSFCVQLGVNFLWSLVFFNLRAYGPAFLTLTVLWGLIVWMTLTFRGLDRTAALLQIPYLLWVFFAGYLNFGVWMLNR